MKTPLVQFLSPALSRALCEAGHGQTLTSEIKKLQKEFEQVYNDNYNALKELIPSLRNTIPNLDQNQLDKTTAELNNLYTESRQADLINLNISQVDQRMNTACGILMPGINNYSALDGVRNK